jgi:hypothetical protein
MLTAADASVSSGDCIWYQTWQPVLQFESTRCCIFRFTWTLIVIDKHPKRSLGSFVASVFCFILGFTLAAGGLLQLGIGINNLMFPSGWDVSWDQGPGELGPPSIAIPDTVRMSPVAPIAQNLMTVFLASVAGVGFLTAAMFWFRGKVRYAVSATLLAAIVAATFIVLLKMA